MLFNMRSLALYGLMAISTASPVPSRDDGMNEIVARAKLGDFLCPDGHTIAESDIRKAFGECRQHNDGTVGKYPAFFGNKDGDNAVLTNVPAGTDLREFPIVEGGVYTTGTPGPYRVITDYKDNRGDFRGVVQHTGATVAGQYTACTKVTKKMKRGDKDKEDKDKKDKEHKKHQVGGDDSSSDSTAKRAAVAAGTSSALNDLAARAKKKKVGSADCNGTTLSKDDVGNAFKKIKELADYGAGGYPHQFGNKSGGSDVFTGVTKDLREYPIIQGGTWTTGEPGVYRVVADYNNNFVGVMIEGSGSSFTRCTVNSD
ncbi:hypothetical protein PFICI_10963 [Pestalotiopsis fici W106-1]|uniref:Uncharacterized protein n=1 Tax=Pestalotiopsis fici (strain W106-1 / CGMCC3.15140) TaxID=1229662 RepID=W3WTF0_PESFW|nr:uncharacterized protein PFICI_10963 [Pestalotiopsis fici W106-1]ETS77089.1 hypothetical protein PFICI_10963 [Pestalotiopsis fici W106-1]